MKIAIIGSGISGLTAAYYLNPDHDITVFESNDYIGGHTDSHCISHCGEDYNIDSGFIVFNEANYPNFARLLRNIDVEWEDSDMSFSVVNEAKNLEYNATNLTGLFSQKKNLFNIHFYRMIRDIFRFYKEAPNILNDNQYRYITLGQYLASENYSKAFMEDHLFPMTSALWSATPEKVKEFPIQYLVAFMSNHKMMQVKDRPMWKVIKGGSNQYIDKLIAGFRHKIRLNSKIHLAARSVSGVTLQVDNRGVERFDKVILACHSNQALSLLADPSEDETRILSMIPYQENKMILHCDKTVMPKKRSAWASWNAMVPQQQVDQCTVTYYMNKLQNINAPVPFLVSLNPIKPIAEHKIFASRTYHHPIYTLDTLRAQHEWDRINGNNHTYYCGAYWSWGFHEDGVKSALRVVECINNEAQCDVA